MMIPFIASLDRPPPELELELVAKGRGVLLVGEPVFGARVTESVKPKGFVVESEARVLPIAVT